MSFAARGTSDDMEAERNSFAGRAFRGVGGHVLFLGGLAAIAALLPPATWDPDAAEFVLIIGAIGIWRYCWAGLHFVRSLIYRHIVFPRWRRAVDAAGEDAMPSHVYLLVTSFRIAGDTTARVYASVIEEAIRCEIPTTIIASIVEMADQRLIKHLFEMADPPPHVSLKFVRIGGTGKRDALAYGFRAIAKENPPEDAVAAVIDGDTILEPGLVRRTAPFFAIFPDVGALTTDEVCEVDGNRIYQEWYSMRFAQRQIQMSSVGLSRYVLTLTGRMSMFRAKVVCDPEFIRQVEVDWIDHWRLGRFQFLTGDDKSTWYFLLRNGWRMLYVHDVRILTVEHAPSDSFFGGSIVLMRRWFGNMLRTNNRAIALGPVRLGLYTWWCIVDQRISMWTCITGLTVAILGSLAVSPMVFVYYAFWILLTRYAMVLCFLTARPTVSAAWPLLLYYNQIVGSFVKLYVVFHLDKQKWTRQNTTLMRDSLGWRTRAAQLSSPAMMALCVAVFITALGLGSGAIELPSFDLVRAALFSKEV
ncbi:MAG: glycosyltransferase family 2 protein [Alphaproteobacteria bacterium]